MTETETNFVKTSNWEELLPIFYFLNVNSSFIRIEKRTGTFGDQNKSKILLQSRKLNLPANYGKLCCT